MCGNMLTDRTLFVKGTYVCGNMHTDRTLFVKGTCVWQHAHRPHIVCEGHVCVWQHAHRPHIVCEGHVCVQSRSPSEWPWRSAVKGRMWISAPLSAVSVSNPTQGGRSWLLVPWTPASQWQWVQMCSTRPETDT